MRDYKNEIADYDQQSEETIKLLLYGFSRGLFSPRAKKEFGLEIIKIVFWSLWYSVDFWWYMKRERFRNWLFRIDWFRRNWF